MKAEIISCGTELLLGEVVDTNTSYLSRELAKIGVNVYHHTTVGDNPERLLETIVHAESRSNLIFLSGGLGPTADDITKDILANHLGLELVVDSTSLNKIKGRYSSEEISSENHHQSLVIDKATVLNNDIGMAAGMFVEKDNKNYVLLPGPPSEFEHMVSEHLVPLLIRRFDIEEKLESRNLNFYGIAEAKVAEKLSDLIEEQSSPTIAIYAKKGIIDIRLTVSGLDKENNKKLLDKLENKIINRIGKYFVSYNKKTMNDIIIEKLELEKSSLSIVEIELNNSYSPSLVNHQSKQNPVKAFLAFSDEESLEQYIGITRSSQDNKLLIKENEKMAYHLKNTLDTDYILVISAKGNIDLEKQSIPEKLYLTIVGQNRKKASKKIYFNKRMYLADWVIPLKINDFIRRYLLSKEQLKN